MPQSSFALLTNLGRAKEAAALANASTIEITHIAIGDGATVPSGGETALYNEVARKTISGHGTVTGAENVAYFDCYLAADDGPYTIREAGLYDSAGDLIAIAHYDPPISKPVPASGQTVEGTVRLEVAFSNIATVVIKVDPSMQVALQRLTQLPWIAVMEMGRNDPPAEPAPGDVYVIGDDPTGTWAGHAGKVAEYTLAGWALLAPRDGHGVGLPDGRVFVRISGSYIEFLATKTLAGLIKLATLQMALDGIDDKTAITPAVLRQLLAVPRESAAANFQKFRTTSRQVITGVMPTAFTATVNKKDAASVLVLDGILTIHNDTIDAGIWVTEVSLAGQAARVGALGAAASTDGVCVCPISVAFMGVNAGDHTLTIKVGRSESASMNIVVNPTSTDETAYGSGTESVITAYEVK